MWMWMLSLEKGFFEKGVVVVVVTSTSKESNKKTQRGCGLWLEGFERGGVRWWWRWWCFEKGWVGGLLRWW